MATHHATQTIEREAKLVAPASFHLPDLSGVVTGATAAPMPTRQLDAVHYDTTDLRLARWGITLRYRSGEPGPPWTVKLPQGENGPVLSRQEISFDGPEGQIPAAAVDLVTAISRGRRLGPVARLSTTRQPVQITDSEARPLAEVVDDTVSVWSRSGQLGEFREVEVEIHQDAPDGRRLLRKAIRHLTAAGCEPEPPISKLVRALGARAGQPADVTVVPLPTGASVADLVQHAIARSVSQIVRHDAGVRLGDDPEDVHQLRVGTRRLRSDLRTFSPLLDRERAAAIRAELGWLGTQVGAARDTDVLAIRLRQTIDTLPEQDRPAAQSLLGRLDSQSRAARDLMLAALRSRRYLRTLDTLIALAASPPFIDSPRLTAPDPNRAAQLVHKPWKALATAVHALADDPSDAELHRVRILAKRCRYAAEAVTPLTEPSAAPFAAAIADVQTVLGDHQDTVVAEAWLRETANAIPATGVAVGELIALERHRRRQLRDQWPTAWKRAAATQLRRWL